MNFKPLYLILVLSILSCQSSKEKAPIPIEANNPIHKTNPLSQYEILNWPVNDIVQDTIPGISLERAYAELLQNLRGDTVVVAVIDTPMDINRPELSQSIWRNEDEIPNNSIDDDANGYVDDIHGWNFMGNPDGRNYIFMNYEYTRILKAYNYQSFEEIDSKTIDFKNEDEHDLYIKAVTKFKEQMDYAVNRHAFLDSLSEQYWKQKEFILKKVKKDTFNLEDLNRLEKTFPDDSELQANVSAFKKHFSVKADDYWIKNSLVLAKNRLEVMLGLDFNDRLISGDDVNTLQDIKYGNNLVNHSLHTLYHGTRMAGIIVSPFESQNLKPLMNHIKIMPLCVSGIGDENDKDMALAIRYAVDNGAQLINISSGKYFSIHEDWVEDAIKYAEENDVLIVASSGNRGVDLDDFDNMKYPNDIDNDGNEFANNFIRVGSSGYMLDSTFVHPATNYGKTEVDIFAPGEKIRTTTTAGKQLHTYSYGTSASAAMVSKVAAIVLSYYPSLTASELKEVILKSGIQYDVSIPKKGDENNEEKMPFSALSKTGAVVNAYNAILLAEETLEEK